MKNKILTIATLVLFSILLICLLPISGTAESIQYHVDSLGCTITCPSDLVALYKEMPDDQLEVYGYSRQVVEETLESGNIYFEALNKNRTFAFYVFKFAAPISIRLNEKDDMFMKSFLISYISSMEKNTGISTIASEIIRTEHNTYVRYEFPFNGEHRIVYYTTADGISYEFVFSCGNEVDPAEDTIVRSIMNDIIWDADGSSGEEKKTLSELLVPTNSDTPAGSVRYQYDNSGISFIIPAGWEERPLSKDREFIKMKMEPLNEPTTTIMFLYFDVWSIMSETDRLSMGILTRKDIDKEFMQPAMIAGAIGVSENEIFIRKYGDYEFAIASIPQSLLGIEYEQIIAATCVNGAIIQFQFANMNNAYLSTFVEVLESLKVIAD